VSEKSTKRTSVQPAVQTELEFEEDIKGGQIESFQAGIGKRQHDLRLNTRNAVRLS
jgi:hypothetical protein